MTDNDLASLEPLEPIAGAAPAAPATQDPMAAQRAGLAAPAFSMYCTDASMYRFLFAGVMIVVGCMMPTTANVSVSGFQTISGGFYTLIGIALIWSWWGSIANNRAMGVKWVLAASIPLIGSIWYTVGFNAEAALELATQSCWVQSNYVEVGEAPKFVASMSLGEMFGDMGSSFRQNAEAAARCGGFWRLYGPGNLLILIGSLIAEFGLIMGIVGGAKQNKKAAQEKRMKASERKRK